LDFHISAFWLEIAYSGSNFEGFGVNKGQISIFPFIMQKSTSLHDSATFESLRVKIRRGVCSLCCSKKKKWI